MVGYPNTMARWIADVLAGLTGDYHIPITCVQDDHKMRLYALLKPVDLVKVKDPNGKNMEAIHLLAKAASQELLGSSSWDIRITLSGSAGVPECTDVQEVLST
jgi:hypothetical protein